MQVSRRDRHCPQSSFGFLNSDLVDQPVDYYGAASAIIDDYFRWRVGASAEDNLKMIQERGYHPD
jgi:hypothetical protein